MKLSKKIRATIFECVKRKKVVSITETALVCKVQRTTAKRHLERLYDAGKVDRVIKPRDHLYLKK